MKKIIITIFFSLWAFSFIGAQELTEDLKKVDLSIETAVSLALANNLELERERIKFDGYKWAAVTSWNTFIPSVSMRATMHKSNLTEDERTVSTGVMVPYPDPSAPVSDYVVSTSVERTRNEWSLSAAFDLSLPLSAAMVFQIAGAGLDYRKGKISLEIAEKKITKNVKKTYYNLVLLQENLKILDQNINAAKRRFDQAVTLYRSGQQNELSMLQAEIRYETLIPQKIRQENMYKTSLLTFKNLIGLKDEAEVILTDKIEMPELTEFESGELISSYLKGALEFQQMKNTLNVLRNARALSIAAMAPTFVIGFSMDPSFQENPIEDSWNYNYNDENWKQSTGGLSFTVNIPISSYAPFSKEQMSLVKSQFAIEEMKTREQELQQNLELNVKNLVQNLNWVAKQLSYLERNLSLAEKTLRLAERQYNLGGKALSDVEDSQDDLNRAKYDLLNARYEYVVGLLELEYSLNTPIERIISDSKETEGNKEK